VKGLVAKTVDPLPGHAEFVAGVVGR
jgi:hypothetical protein